MNKYLYILAFIISGYQANAQRCCLTNSLIINTGYDPVTNSAIPPGPNGATAVKDPHWIVTSETPGIAAAIPATPITGLVEVIPGGNADIVPTLGGWVSSPSGKSNYISCLNSNSYVSDGAATVYEMTLSRPFTLCSDDSVILDLYISNDNYVVASDFDGGSLGFSQPPFPVTSTYFTTFAHVTRTVFASSGTHSISITVGNINVAGDNPTGLNVYGTVSTKTGINNIVAEADPACASYVCTVIPENSINRISLADTLYPCKDSAALFNTTLTGTDSVRSYEWSPVTDLSSSTVLSPTLTAASVSGYYYLTVNSLINYNLVTNGDFECGNTGFSSSYIYSPPPSPILIEGDYSVDTDPSDVHSGFSRFGDHTTGMGKMMILNGAPTPVDVWCETINVSPNTDYDFSAWFANASAGGPGSYPILQFRINGVLIGTPTTISDPVGSWVSFYSSWNSGTNTTANICIYDATTSAGGNDFVIDDISFRKIAVTKDSVFIHVLPPDTTYGRIDDSICSAASSLVLTAPAGYHSYQWSTGSTATSIAVTAPGIYWLYNNAECNKTLIDSFYVRFITSPVVNLGNDTAFCVGGELVLKSTQPAGYTYLWNTGATDSSITVTTIGKYWLSVTDTGCTTTDSINIVVSPIPVVDLGPDYINCKGIFDTLRSSGIYDAPIYLWNDATTNATTTANVTGKYWLQVIDNGCAAADTINVTIVYDTLNFYNHDTAICKGAIVPTFVTGNSAQTYQWLPTAGIPASTVINPVILADTSATYVLTTSMTLCPDRIDSFHIDVQPNPSVYIGDNRMVCEFDSLRVIAAVTPNWYRHYIYSWSPAASLDNANTSAVTFTAGDYTQLMLTVSTPAGCAGKDSAELIVHPGNFAIFDTTYDICPHDSVQFRPAGGIAYEWHPGIYLNDSFGMAPWARVITSQQYRMIATSAFGCKDTLTVRVNVHPAGVLYLGNTVTLYPGESYHISPQTNCTRFSWFPTTGLDNAYVADPVAKPEVSTRYIVHTANEWGCKATDSIDIKVEPATLLDLPNAFAPGSGSNKKFTIIKKGMADLKYFRIFNRWGNKVFETTNIDEGWDGTYNGVPQPFGVYIYEVIAVTSAGKDFEKHGNVTLIR